MVESQNSFISVINQVHVRGGKKKKKKKKREKKKRQLGCYFFVFQILDLFFSF